MILAVDVAYRNETAVAAGILFRDWQDEKPFRELVVPCAVPDNYIPGRFYRRELPCIEALLAQVAEKPDCIIIDGFVHLAPGRRPGLGKYLHDLLVEKTAVIGVAKSPFRDTPASWALRRGASAKPLYVTAVGMDEERAKFLVGSMHGQARIPTLLKYVDRLCRTAAPEG